MKKVYTTKRLVLKTLDASFAHKVLNYYEKNQDFLRPWEPKRDKMFYTLAFHRKTLKTEIDLIDNLAMLRLWIFEKKDYNFDRIIGTVSFSNIVRGAFQSCFLGYKLDQNYTNRGYMTEAIDKGIDVMFNDYKLHRIEANIIPRNYSSLKVVEKLGFENEGLSKKYLKINDVWEDHIHMVLLGND